MPPLQQRMSEDSHLRGLSARTQDAYVRAVRQLAEPYPTAPARIPEEERRDSFLYLKNVTHDSRSASTLALCGITFFYEHTLKRAGSPLPFVRAPREKKLPVSRRVEEGHTLLAHLKLRRYWACLTTLYSWGRRRQEGTPLQGPDLDRARMLVHVRHGKGAKARSVPLPQRTLALLRQDWKPHRHPLWRFPAPGRGGVGMSTAAPPMPRASVQEAFRVARTPSGNNKRAAGHPLRPSSATHWLEAGVTLRLIQDSVGPNTPTTTALYTHLTLKADALARQARTELMSNL